jgi:hypothetical protein
MATWSGEGRRPAIDVARILALVVVVMGHLTLAVIDRGHDGALRGANLLALRPGWAALAVLSPMPIFFAAAGWANTTSDLRSGAARLRTLVGLGAVVVTGWVLLAAVAWAVTGESGIVTDGARIATQPLWFLAAYVPLAAAAPWVLRAAHHVVAALAICLSVLVVLDVTRFVLDAPDWIGWPGFAAAWTVPWLLGIWWRLRVERGGFPERRVGLALALSGAATCVVLVRTAGYSPALIDAIPGARSNTTPPTLYTAAAAVTQVGVLMLAAGLLDRLGARWARLWAWAGEAAVGVYVLHLTALSLCAAVLAAGVPTPTRLTCWWWATRPLWWVAVLGVTALLVAGVDLGRRSIRRRHGPTDERPSSTDGSTAIAGRHRVVLWLGVGLATIGGAVVGLKGPRTVPTAILCVVAFLGGWWCLGAPDRAARRHEGAPCPS